MSWRIFIIDYFISKSEEAQKLIEEVKKKFFDKSIIYIYIILYYVFDAVYTFI